MKILLIGKKTNVIYVVLILFIIGLVTFSTDSINAAKNGLMLCYTAIIPTLFPFFVFTYLLTHSDFSEKLSKLLNPFMQPVFNLPGSASLSIIMGTISGYPVGAKTTCSLYKQGLLNKEQAERLLAFSNNGGPLFIIGTIGTVFYKNPSIGFILYISHIIAAIFVGVIFGIFSKKNNWAYTSKKNYHKPLKKESLSVIFGKAVSDGVTTILMVCGFVVFFSVFIEQLNILSVKLLGSTSILHCIISGFLEITNGISNISKLAFSLKIRLFLTSVILGMGGICVYFQVKSIAVQEKLSCRKYCIGKALQGLSAGLIFPFIYRLFPLSEKAFNNEMIPIIDNMFSQKEVIIVSIAYTGISLLFLAMLSFVVRLFKN